MKPPSNNPEGNITEEETVKPQYVMALDIHFTAEDDVQARERMREIQWQVQEFIPVDTNIKTFTYPNTRCNDLHQRQVDGAVRQVGF